MLLADPKDIKI